MNISIKKMFFSISEQILKAILLERIFLTKNIFLMNAFNTGRQMIVFFRDFNIRKAWQQGKTCKNIFWIYRYLHYLLDQNVNILAKKLIFWKKLWKMSHFGEFSLLWQHFILWKWWILGSRSPKSPKNDHFEISS